MTAQNRSWIEEHYRPIILIILLVAAGLRLYGISSLAPVGLAHDEVAHWLINQDILSGNHAVFFTEAYGHEAGYHYVQALFMVLLGDNVLSLRIVSAFTGVLVVAVTFALTRYLFGMRKALLSAGLLAVLLFPVFYSRPALRAISLPLLSGLSAYFWWLGWDRWRNNDEKARQSLSRVFFFTNQGSIAYFVLGGIFAGLTIYTYQASRAIPIFFLLFTLYLVLFHRPAFKQRWKGVLLFFVVLLVISIPMTVYFLTNPGTEIRAGEVNHPLRDLSQGDPTYIIENGLKILAMFGFRGDPLWRYNVAFLPVFEPISAIFFYIGLFISTWRWRKPRYLFIVLWLFVAAIPSIVTIDAPSSIRIINILPVLTIFPAIGLEVIHFLGRLSTVSARLSTKTWRILAPVALVVLFVLYIGRTAQALFQTWPANDEVQFLYQEALTEAAVYLDNAGELGPVAIGGWTPESMDPPTMFLALRRDDLSLRYFNPTHSLIIPAATGNNSHINIIRPSVLPLDPALEAVINNWGAQTQTQGSFTRYELGDAPVVNPQFPAQVSFGTQIEFIGYDLFEGERTESDFPIELISYWRVQEPVNEQRRIFLHLTAEDDVVINQDDLLGAPSPHWQPGDLVIQRLSLTVPSDGGPYSLRIGMYDPVSGQRLTTEDGVDFFLLTNNLG